LLECKKALKDSQFIVDIKVKNTNTFTVFIDDTKGLSINECKRINKQICAAFDRDIEDFALEVSSPGIDKPFKVIQQYHKNINRPIEVLFVDGEKLTGKLLNVENNIIELQIENKIGKKTETTVEKIDIKNIKKANVLLLF